MTEKPGSPLEIASADELLKELVRRYGAIPEALANLQALYRLIHRKPDTPQTELKARAREWTDNIRQNGSAIVHTKAHPAWFSTSFQEAVIVKEPGFADHGHIGCQPQQTYWANRPLTEISVQMFLHGNYAKDDNYLLLSALEYPDHEFNEKMLDTRFSGNWREVRFMTWLERRDQYSALFRGSVPLPFDFSVFLPDKEANRLFTDMEDHPQLGFAIMDVFYPNLRRHNLGLLYDAPLRTAAISNNSLPYQQALQNLT